MYAIRKQLCLSPLSPARLRRLLAWCEKTFETIYWGTGMRSGSFTAYVQWSPDRVATVFSVWTYGTVEIAFQYLAAYAPYDREEKRRDLLARLNGIEGISLPEGAHSRRPSFPISDLSDERVFTEFTGVIQTVVEELLAARDEAGSTG